MNDANEPQEQPTPVHPAARLPQVLRAIWRRVENSLFGLILTLIVLYFVLQSSVVQNWLIGKITGYLSKELHTTVRVGHVDISFFDNLLLEDFYVADLHGDTLLYAEQLSAGLNSNIFSLLSRKLEFNEIRLMHARLNIRRQLGETDNNLQFILDYFSNSDKTSTPSRPFRIRVKNMRLTDVQFLSDDRENGKTIFASVPNGFIRVNNLDLPSKIVDVQTVQLTGIIFSVKEYAGNPNPVVKAVARPVSNTQPESDSILLSITKVPLRITVGRLTLQEGQFYLDKTESAPARDSFPEVMDFKHMAVRKIALEADSVYADDDLSFRGILHHLAAQEKSGFEIKHLEAGRVEVNSKLAALYGMHLETLNSALGDSIAFHYSTYRDFRKFNDKIRMVGHFTNGSTLRLQDIMHFSSAVAGNKFFKTNKAEAIQISGHMDGRVNRLNGRDLNIRVGDDTVINCDFDGNDMAEGSERIRLLFDIKKAQTNMRRLRKIIPGFNPPEYFDRLGNVNFHGFYQILFGSNHILAGDLVTDIGYGSADMKIDLAGGPEKATYSGLLDMHNFDLSKWTGNKDIGKATFRVQIADGTGLTARTLRTQVKGTVDSFYFKGYNYRNVELNGKFNQSVFDGHLAMEDPNIDFNFDGSINFNDSVPVYDFQADLRRLDLKALNLVKEDWVVSGKIQKIKLYAKNLNNLSGSISLRNFRLIQDKEYVHRVDSLTFAAINRPGGDRYFILLSDIADGHLQGHFELNRMMSNLHRLVYKYYPKLVGQAFGEPVADEQAGLDKYKINLEIKNTRGLTRLLDTKLDTIRNLTFKAEVNAQDGLTEFDLKSPLIRYNGIQLVNTDLFWHSVKEKGRFTFVVPQALLSKGQRLANINLTGNLEQDNLDFTLVTEDSLSIVQRINLNGELSTIDSLWQIKFNTSDITLFNEQWFMDEDNYLRFSKTYFDARNFDLMNGIQRIVIDSFNQGRGALFSLANFDLNFLEKFFPLDNIRYRGKIFNLDVELYDLFGLSDFKGYITTDTVYLNDKPYGSLIGNVELLNLQSPLWWRLFLNDKDNHQLKVLGAWALDNRAHDVPEIGEIRAGEFQTIVEARDFPMRSLELIVPDISKTSGKINAEARLGGPFKRVAMNGRARVDGGFQLDYMKAMFYIPNQIVTLSEYQIWADKDTILDGSGTSRAMIRGGLRHDHFRDWRLDCDIKSEGNNFMILNTLRDDNSLYYGQGIGKFEAKFTGSFSKTNIYINATTGKDTRLNIPLSSSSDINEASFIKFKDKNTTASGNAGKSNTKSFVLEEIKGLNLEMNLTVTDDAEVQLIFDEQAGDVIKGRGEGDIRMTINREGEFKMYGTYQIRRGEYLFTLLNWVNKPFTVAEGGSINWYGDPYGAQISLDATYAENTSLYNLLRDELASSDSRLSEEATISTKAVVTMHLKGDLFKPAISFDLAFPSSSSSLKSLVDSKLSQLRQDQNEMTRQVFGLVVVGSFLPPASGGAGTLQSSDYLASAFNTLTQVLSNQFSNYLTGLATEWFGKTVSSIDFDIAYNEYRNDIQNTANPNLSQIGRELQVRLTSGFINDRITVQTGFQFGLGQPGTSTSDGFLGEDVTIEIQVTENRNWRLKVYQRTEPDIAGGARRSRAGFGITFHKEYDSFSSLIQGLTGWMSPKKK